MKAEGAFCQSTPLWLEAYKALISLVKSNLCVSLFSLNRYLSELASTIMIGEQVLLPARTWLRRGKTRAHDLENDFGQNATEPYVPVGSAAA